MTDEARCSAWQDQDDAWCSLCGADLRTVPAIHRVVAEAHNMIPVDLLIEYGFTAKLLRVDVATDEEVPKDIAVPKMTAPDMDEGPWDRVVQQLRRDRGLTVFHHNDGPKT